MAKLARPAEEDICANCPSYGFKRRDSGGWAFCYFFEKWFPKQTMWTESTPEDQRVKPAGLRSCRNFGKKVAS